MKKQSKSYFSSLSTYHLYQYCILCDATVALTKLVTTIASLTKTVSDSPRAVGGIGVKRKEAREERRGTRGREKVKSPEIKGRARVTKVKITATNQCWCKLGISATPLLTEISQNPTVGGGDNKWEQDIGRPWIIATGASGIAPIN